MADEATDVKPGWKTTEFWLSIVTAVLGIVVMLGYITPEQSTTLGTAISSIVGGVMTVISTIGYALSRAKTKSRSR